MLIPSLADVIFVALLGSTLALRAQQFINSDGDLARHLAVGRQILATGAIPTADLFSHTKAGEPFVPYEWLSEAIFALAHQLSGLEGVVALSAVLATLPFLLLTRWMVREGSNPFAVLFLVTVGALASSIHWLARPHLFTTLLALLWARALARHQETGSPRPLLLLPPIMVLWANLHGGFLVGFVILAVFLGAAAVDRVRDGGAAGTGGDAGAGSPPRPPRSPRPDLTRLALAGAASLLAVGANPSGYAILPHLLGYFRSRLMVDNTVEYMSPNFHDLGAQLFLVLLLVAMVSMAWSPRPIPTADLGLLAVWTAFALYSARNIPLFVVICLPAVARLATHALSGRSQAPRPPGLAGRLAARERLLGGPLLPSLVVVLALALSTGRIGEFRPAAAFDPAVFPVEALARAEQVGAAGNPFNYLSWGGYVLYASHPRYRVFIDGQTDFYGEQLMRDYLRVARLEPEWEDVLDRYRVDWVLFPHRSPLSLLLARSSGWRLAYQDSTADLFVRTEPKER